MIQFLKRLNEEAKTEAIRRRDEALEPFLTKAPFDGGKEVNPWCVIDEVGLCYLRPCPGDTKQTWKEYRPTLYNSFREAIRGVNNSAAQAIVLTHGPKILEWIREYNREMAHKHRRHYS